MLILLIVLASFFIVTALFAFPVLSPIPYFPSNNKDIHLILQALQLTDDQVIIDLGAGDGIVIFKAAEEATRKKFNTQFVAVEINPILLIILHLRRLFHPNRRNIHIRRTNMFTITKNGLPISPFLNSQILIYLYISPWFMEKVVANARKEFDDFSIVSYLYPYKGEKSTHTLHGVHDVYRYEINTRRSMK
ncbi:hypothetical protein HGB07_05190 [Candidatus Roizmanbacteria bacterium]|nr:hypothetical protein [Candidatus Roizmanbacteria bacterium]